MILELLMLCMITTTISVNFEEDFYSRNSIFILIHLHEFHVDKSLKLYSVLDVLHVAHPVLTRVLTCHVYFSVNGI